MLRILMLSAAALALSACHPRAATPDAGVQAAAESPEAKAFLANNARQPGVHVLPDGLQYKVVSSGPATGNKPHINDEVKVNYEGRLIDGKVFDSSYERGQPAAMPLSRLVKAWQEALQMMRPGDVWMLYVPPELGYGAQGSGDGQIPGGAVLIFKIELIDFLPGPGSVEQG